MAAYTYKGSGVDVGNADAVKKGMAGIMATGDPRVLNGVGGFASLYDGRFPDMECPVLVMKTEEPGSKQLLAIKEGRYGSIAFDMVNHLVNDIAVMGARPLAVQDAIICSKVDGGVVAALVAGIAEACVANECVLTGGETSEQPGVVAEGVYILTSSIVGVVDRGKVIDGAGTEEGDVVLALESNGMHTNGYSLLRALMADRPGIMREEVCGVPFMDEILRPHRPYYKVIKGLFGVCGIKSFAHITGGGIAGNLNRVLPDGLSAEIDLPAIRIPPIFRLIKERGGVDDREMLATFNMGVGMTAVVSPERADWAAGEVAKAGCRAYAIGEVRKGGDPVAFRGSLDWGA